MLEIKYAIKSKIKHRKFGSLLVITQMPVKGRRLAHNQDYFYECVEEGIGITWIVSKTELEGEKFELEQDSFLSKKYNSLSDMKK